ncbi:hypothetical protein CFP65_1387 [Kitasatospora sp. MMS16-BH015]|uniref:hypothetical protein n=1 Tax=Kitasatospora sp. MMS16-BH015 TaxID=2018025 RepID=UPI000CA117B3|nr:hypothetical protein [Kitasatospora sp. MMS16-BH015]AUG76286.1 hypothetical protein CFP65_1387 [Kitasatospora sp. MMS16-BH015]
MSTTTSQTGPPPGRAQLLELRNCFVIGPVGSRYADAGSAARQVHERTIQLFEAVIRPVCETFGAVPVRADQLTRDGEVTDQIQHHLQTADLLIADVSDGDPTVLYELGIRRGAGKPVVLLGEFGRLPAGLPEHQTIRFERSRDGLATARETLMETVVRALRGPDGSGSCESPEEDPGLLEQFVDLETDLEALSEGMATMTGLLLTIAEHLEYHGPRLQRVARDGSPMSTQLAVSRQLAAALAAPAAGLKVSAAGFAARLAHVDPTVHAALDLFRSVPPVRWNGDDRGFLAQLVDLSAAARNEAANLAAFRFILSTLTAMHSELAIPAGDIGTAVDQLGAAMTRVGAWDDRARLLSG